VDKPLRPIKSILWVFCLGSGPVFVWFLVFCCLLRCVLWRNASLAGGFAGRRVWLVWWLCVFLIDLPAQMDMICPCTNAYLAYAHVRTEPLARHRPHSRKKKQQSSMRKPGIPPARIAEITESSHSGITFTQALRSKQRRRRVATRVCNDLAKAMKALDGKKQCRVATRVVRNEKPVRQEGET